MTKNQLLTLRHGDKVTNVVGEVLTFDLIVQHMRVWSFVRLIDEFGRRHWCSSDQIERAS